MYIYIHVIKLKTDFDLLLVLKFLVLDRIRLAYLILIMSIF